MPFKKGQSGNPAGRLKGKKDLIPRSAKRAVAGLIERVGSDTVVMGRLLREGLHVKPPGNFPFFRLVVEQQIGAPEQPISGQTIIVHKHLKASSGVTG